MKPFLTFLVAAAMTHGIAPFSQAETPAGAGKHLFILSGQSNMRQPLPNSFQAVAEKTFGKDQVLVVTHAHPSQPIRRWYKQWRLPEGMEDAERKNGKEPAPNGSLYDAMMAQVKQAIGDKPLASVTYIWMQGEADAVSGWSSVYEESFYGVLDQIKADLGVEKIHYVLGRINDFWLTGNGIIHGDQMRQIQQKIGEAHPWGAWVDTDDLNTGVNPWGVYQFCDGHFPPAAYEVLGERFARKACALINPAVPIPANAFSSAYFDSSRMIASHAGIGGAVGGSAPVSGNLAALSDGKFAPLTANDAQWARFTPGAENSTELTLDLGAAKTLGQIGISLLCDPQAGFPRPEHLVIEASADGANWQKVGHDISFSYHLKVAGEIEETKRARNLLALIQVPKVQGKATAVRFLRFQIKAADILVDEIVVDPKS